MAFVSMHLTIKTIHSVEVFTSIASFFSEFRKLPKLSFETHVNYHLDGYLMHNFAVKTPLLISPVLNLFTYTDFNKTSVMLRPGIGLDAAIISISYDFNWLESDNIGLNTKHNFSLFYRFGMAEHMWRNPHYYKSQYDLRKVKRKKGRTRP
jgi:hypothetical protein